MTAKLDLTGHTYHELTVLRATEDGKKWICLCSCGAETVTTTNQLRTGNTKSCGHLKQGLWSRNKHPQTGKKGLRKDWTGQKLHRLTFVAPTDEKRDGRVVWHAKCDCGGQIDVIPKYVVSGNTKSCGCMVKERGKKLAKILKGRSNIAARNAEDKIGKTFGKLTVTAVEYRDLYEQHHGTVAFGICSCECGGELTARMSDLTTGRTVSCGCGKNVSETEQELADWLSEYIGIEQQYEINGWRYDIAVPEKKLLIEYNGVWWHSSKFIHGKTHLVKRRNAEDEGYRVITVWSDDYERKRDRIQSLILSIIDEIKPRKLGARQVSLQEIERDEAIDFHRKYHVQVGNPSGRKHIGVFHNGDLIAVSTFRYSKKIELTRYTVLPGLAVHGLLSKIIHHIQPDRDLVTYCDRDYFDGKLYKSAGFKRTGTTQQLTYTKSGGVRVRRENYMKSKLGKMGIAVEGKTEKEALHAAGIYQCWNSGIDRYEWSAD